MDHLFNIVQLELLITILSIGYLGGAIGVFLSFFRPGINPNIPIARSEGKREFLIIIIISGLWPIVALIEILKPSNQLCYK